jgi:hypothetical protein
MSDEGMIDRSNELKEKITGLFAGSSIVEQLNLVDTLQHLSIDHHFHEQILSTLRSTHAGEFNSSSIHDVALRFRLLRQQGLWVSPGIHLQQNLLGYCIVRRISCFIGRPLLNFADFI